MQVRNRLVFVTAVGGGFIYYAYETAVLCCAGAGTAVSEAKRPLPFMQPIYNRFAFTIITRVSKAKRL
jgi:hypothetical protein